MVSLFLSVMFITGLKIEVAWEKIVLSRRFVLNLSEDKESHDSEASE